MTMRYSGLQAIVVLTLIAGSVTIGGQSQTPAGGTSKTATSAAKPWVQPKTAWGDPDISGIWTSDAARGIPRERPAQFGNRAMLTDEEFSEKVKADEKMRRTAEN